MSKEFHKGEKVYVVPQKSIAEKWHNQPMEIITFHINHNPLAYSCIHHPTGTKLVFSAPELESVFQHDKRLGLHEPI